MSFQPIPSPFNKVGRTNVNDKKIDIAEARDQLAAAAANNTVLQDALDHALQEMDSVRKAVAVQARASQDLQSAISGAALPQATGSNSQECSWSGVDDAALKAERIKELQRELAAVLEERHALQMQLEGFESLDHPE